MARAAISESGGQQHTYYQALGLRAGSNDFPNTSAESLAVLIADTGWDGPISIAKRMWRRLSPSILNLTHPVHGIIELPARGFSVLVGTATMCHHSRYMNESKRFTGLQAGRLSIRTRGHQ